MSTILILFVGPKCHTLKYFRKCTPKRFRESSQESDCCGHDDNIGYGDAPKKSILRILPCMESTRISPAIDLQDIAERVPGMYMILGMCYMVLGTFGAWLLSPPPAGPFPGTVAFLATLVG